MRHMTRIALAWPVALVLLAGCGAAGMQYRTSTGEALPAVEPEGSPGDYAARIDRLHRELQTLLGTGPAEEIPDAEAPAEPSPSEDDFAPSPYEQSETPSYAADAPDSGPSETPSRCEIGAELRDRICELARRICELAGKHPGDAELARQCQSATATCGQAGRDVDDAC